MDYQIILDFISQHDGVTQEYPLLQHIEAEHPAFFNSLGDSPSLYRKHFFLFHHLHRLNQQLARDNLRLVISPLEISLCSNSQASKDIGQTDPLKDFYLDESNLYMSDEAIVEMQNAFWQKYLALDKKAEAIKVLQIAPEEKLTKKLLKQRYNRLAQQHHPDKGGDERIFMEIKRAYEDLLLVVK